MLNRTLPSVERPTVKSLMGGLAGAAVSAKLRQKVLARHKLTSTKALSALVGCSN